MVEVMSDKMQMQRCGVGCDSEGRKDRKGRRFGQAFGVAARLASVESGSAASAK
jgi:hypothetical protein